MKIHVSKARRVPGFRVAVEYQWNGEKMMLVSTDALDRTQVRENVREMVGTVREAKKAARMSRVARVKTGGEK